MLYISYIWVYIEHMFYILLLAPINSKSNKNENESYGRKK